MKLEDLNNLYKSGAIDLSRDLVEVDSPDGFVRVVDIIDRGLQPCYLFEFPSGHSIICTLNHKVETDIGWLTCGEINSLGLSKKTFISLQPTIDLEVEHSNHRFYCNDISVHNSTKGLEYDHVIACGFTYRSQNMVKLNEEELNMFYVQISRAIKSVMIVYSDFVKYMGEEEQGYKSKWLVKLLQYLNR